MNTSRKLLCSREQKHDKTCLHTGVLACPVSRTWQQSPRSHSVSLNVLQEDGWMLQAPACAARKLMLLLIQLLSYPMELMYPCLQSLPTEMEAKCWDFKMSFVQKLFFFFLSSYAGWRGKRDFSLSISLALLRSWGNMSAALMYTCKALTRFFFPKIFLSPKL